MTTLSEQRDAWARRVAQYGVTRAPFHLKQRPEDFDRITEEQWAVVRPPLARAIIELRPADYTRVILDAGCAWGRWTERLADLSKDYLVTGVDLVPESIREATIARRTLQTSYALVEPDGTIPVQDARFDVAFSWTVLSAILDPDLLTATITEWMRVLRPDGLVALIDNTSKVGGGAVRSPWSVSRTVEEYQDLFAPWVTLIPVTEFTDLGEVHTLLLGRRR